MSRVYQYEWSVECVMNYLQLQYLKKKKRKNITIQKRFSLLMKEKYSLVKCILHVWVIKIYVPIKECAWSFNGELIDIDFFFKMLKKKTS